MRNPWGKKNPFMSIWLSEANRMLNATRGRATSEAHRHAAHLMSQGQKQILEFWSSALFGPAPRKRRKPR